jgi:hypothetical protein
VKAGPFLRDYLFVLARGIWSGFGLTDTSVIVAIVLIFIASFFAEISGEGHPPAWMVAGLSLFFVAFEVLRAAYQLYAKERQMRESLELAAKPQLALGAPSLAPTFKRVSNKPSIPASYARLSIRNTGGGTVSKCSAKLVKIEYKDRQSGWRLLPYTDTLNMAWSNKSSPEASKEIDLHAQDADTLDLLYYVQGSRELHIASIVAANYPGLLALAGDYRLTLLLTSSSAGSQTAQVTLSWNFQTISFGNIEIVQ